MRDVVARLVFTARWYVGGRLTLAQTWRASGVFVDSLRAARFRRYL
jgi:hypothetical protein